MAVKLPTLRVVESPGESDLDKCREFGKSAAQATLRGKK